MQAERMEQDGRTDFDFFVGRWKVHNRRLRERLKGSTDWEEFEGTSQARTVLGGLGNMDEITLERASGRVYGMTVRLYDPASQQWRLYWADTIHGIFDTPVIGKFKDGRGVFGRPSPPVAAGGNKPFPPMAGKPGRPTGLWISPASRNDTAGLDMSHGGAA